MGKLIFFVKAWRGTPLLPDFPQDVYWPLMNFFFGQANANNSSSYVGSSTEAVPLLTFKREDRKQNPKEHKPLDKTQPKSIAHTRNYSRNHPPRPSQVDKNKIRIHISHKSLSSSPTQSIDKLIVLKSPSNTHNKPMCGSEKKRFRPVRDPSLKAKEIPVKTTVVAIFLLVFGASFLIAGFVTWLRWGVSEAMAFWILGGIAFIPGSYTSGIILGTWLGVRGYRYDLIPSYDEF